MRMASSLTNEEGVAGGWPTFAVCAKVGLDLSKIVKGGPPVEGWGTRRFYGKNRTSG